MGVVDGRFFIEELAPEQVAAEVERIESLIGFIESDCEVVGGTSLLEIDPETRAGLLKVLGASCADAIGAAKARSALLWTDDLAVAQLAKSSQLGVESVWTQAVLATAASQHRLSEEAYRELLSGLLVGRYSYLRLSCHDIVAMLELAKWQSKSAVGVALAELLGNVGIEGPQNTMISIFAIVMAWFKAPNETVGGQTIIELLEQIKPPARRYYLARRVYRAVGIPLEPGKLRRLKRYLRHWRSGDGPFKPDRPRSQR